MIMVSKFTFNISNFSVKFGILFSTVVNAVFVAKLLISGILFSTVVNAVFVARLLISGIFFSNSVLLVSY